MEVRVRLAGALRPYAAGRSVVCVDVNGDRLVDVLDALARAHPDADRRIRDETGEVRVHVNLFIGTENARDLGGLGAPVTPGAEVSVLPAVSGG